MDDLGCHSAREGSGPERTLHDLDRTDLRLRVIRLRGECWTHLTKAVLGAFPFAILAVPGARQAPVVWMLSPVVVHVVLEVWRGVRAYRALGEARDL